MVALCPRGNSVAIVHLFKMGHSRALFIFIFVFSIQLTVSAQYQFLPMTGFELQTSGVGSDRSTNLVTATAKYYPELHICQQFICSHCRPTNGWILIPEQHKKNLWWSVIVSIWQVYSKWGREPWSSGYGWGLMFETLWVQIPALLTRWTFFHIDLL